MNKGEKIVKKKKKQEEKVRSKTEQGKKLTGTGKRPWDSA